jgi:RpiR family transcriptional regulator, carbohydrate utilization regulator
MTKPGPADDATVSDAVTTHWVRPRVMAAAASLQPGEAKVARLLLDSPDSVIYQSASEFAEAAGTSTATVVRFAQKIGFKGFHELKLKLAQDQALFRHQQLESADSAAGSVLERVTSAGAQSVKDAAALVSPAAFDEAVAILGSARRVLFAGVGTSAPLAQDAAYRFRTIGIESDAPADVHVQHVASRLLRPEDACVAISHTGSTRETLMVVETAKASGAATVAVTSFLRSPLTEVADVVLTAGSREVSFRLEAMASRLAHMAVVDALLVAVAETDEKRSRLALDLFADVLGEHRI